MYILLELIGRIIWATPFAVWWLLVFIFWKLPVWSFKATFYVFRMIHFQPTERNPSAPRRRDR